MLSKRSFSFYRLTALSFASLCAASCGGSAPVSSSEDLEEGVTGCETTVLRSVPPNNPSFIDTPVDVGFGITRIARSYCGSSCVKEKECIVKGNQVTTCVQWAPDCFGSFVEHVGETDFANASDATSSKLFLENNEGPSWHYLGCGPQAAMNILNYWGVNLSIDAVYRMSNTIYIKSDAIAEYPDDLKDSIRVMLDSYADGAFTVTRHSGVDVRGMVRGHLAYGWPSIVLAKGGDHYLTVLAWSAPDQYYVIDYPTSASAGPQSGSGRWISEQDLDTKLNPFVQAGAALVAGVGGWFDDTVITIERTGPKPPPVVIDPFVCGVNNSMFCCVDTPGDIGRCNDRNIRFNQGGTNIMSLGYNLRVQQTSQLGGCPDQPEQKFDFVPDAASGVGWYRIVRHDRSLCIAPSMNRSSPDLATIDCSNCLTDPARCAWRFTGKPNSQFKLQNKATNNCIYSDDGEKFENGTSALHQNVCATGSGSDINVQRELLILDDFGDACP